MESKIERAVQNIVPSIIEKCLNPVQEKLNESVSTTVTTNLTKTWSETLFGAKEFPDIRSAEATNAPVKPKNTLSNVLKKSLSEQKEEEDDRAVRLNNVILHNVPESSDKDSKVRESEDVKYVDELLAHLDIQSNPVKLFRLGKYKEPEVRGTETRPIKVVFENSEIQNNVMSAAKKLKNAPKDFNEVSCNYDLSEKERAEVKSLVMEAKNKTKNSTTHDYRVRGPPGKMQIKAFRRRTPAEAEIINTEATN